MNLHYDPIEDAETLQPPTPWQVFRWISCLAVFGMVALSSLVWVMAVEVRKAPAVEGCIEIAGEGR